MATHENVASLFYGKRRMGAVDAAGLLRGLSGHKGDVNAARFTADASGVVTASDDNTLKLWDASDGTLVSTLTGHQDKVLALAVSLRDSRVASGALDGTIKFWDLVNGRVLKEINQGTEVMSPRLQSRRQESALRRRPRAVPVPCLGRRDRKRGGELWRPRQHRAGHGPCRKNLAATSGGNDNEIHLWDAESGKLTRALVGVGRAIWSVGFSPDGRAIAWGVERA